MRGQRVHDAASRDAVPQRRRRSPRSSGPAGWRTPKELACPLHPKPLPSVSARPNSRRTRSKSFQANALGNAIGHHEVIIESPNHDESPADAELPQLELLIHAYIDRLRELSAKPYVKYVSIFRNYGQQAGASLTHAHSQIIATPMVPPMIQEEMDASKKFYAEHGKCVFCDIIERETKGPRLIYDGDGLCGFCSLRKHQPDGVLDCAQKTRRQHP